MASRTFRMIRPYKVRALQATVFLVLWTATLIAGCALMREESRGAHERLDFPETLPGAGKRSRVTLAEVSALRDEICKEMA